MPLNPSPELVFADGPGSNPQHPYKPDIRRIFRQIEQIIDAFTSSGGVIYSSKAALDADLARPLNTMAWVLGDATAANNGIYRKVGVSGAGNWVRAGDLPYSFILASNVGGGTPSAIEATTSIPVNGSTLILLQIAEDYVGTAATVRFNGGAALSIKTNSGADVRNLAGGSFVYGVISGGVFRLANDEAIANIIYEARDDAVAAKEASEWARAGAEMARDDSEAARDIAVESANLSEAFANQAQAAAESSGDVVFFGTFSEATSASSGLPDSQVVSVFVDETRSDYRTFYRKESGALVFKGYAGATVGQGQKADTALQPLSLIQTRSSIARGASISDALWSARIDEFKNGERGTTFVWNDPVQDDLVAGFNPGQQIWIGDNPTPTPGAGHAVASTICVANGRGRNALYGQNILVGAANAGASYSDSFICGMEINVYADFPSTVSDAFSGGNRKNGLELTSQGSTGRVTAAAMIWSADPSGNAWWHQGLAISRCVDAGISFQKAPGGVADGVNPFNVAAIHDKSDSRSVLKIDGTHENVFDISGVSSPGAFVKGRSGQHTTLLMKNSVNFNFDLVLDSGGSAAQVSSITLSDRGSAKFQIAKSAGNALAIIDMAAGISVMSFDGNTNDAVVIRVGGQDKRVQVGAPDSAGSGFRSLRVSN